MEINGTRSLARLSPRQSDVARLAVLFNQSRRDVADEFGISQGQVNKLVAEIYHELGLTRILSGETEAERYFQDETILRRFHRARERAKQSGRSAREKPTLAFHLLTLAEVREKGR